jgi:hypothetical protein
MHAEGTIFANTISDDDKRRPVWIPSPSSLVAERSESMTHAFQDCSGHESHASLHIRDGCDAVCRNNDTYAQPSKEAFFLIFIDEFRVERSHLLAFVLW